ncbi:MAG: hypothetical protein ABWY25_07090 [Paenisporosarcina sp.]
MAIDWAKFLTPLPYVESFAYSPTLRRITAGGGGVSGAGGVEGFAYSDDGMTWLPGTCSPVPVHLDRGRGIIWNPVYAKFYAFENRNDSDNLITSADGINWTTIVNPPPTGGGTSYNVIAVNPSGHMLCVGVGFQTLYFGVSLVWQAYDGMIAIGFGPWNDVVWHPGSNVWVAIAEDGDIRIATGPNDITWTGRHGFEVAYQKSWSKLACNSVTRQMVAVSTFTSPFAMTSMDGFVWTVPTAIPTTLTSPYNVLTLIHTMRLGGLNGKYIFIINGRRGGIEESEVMVSEDGINWTVDSILPKVTVSGTPRSFYASLIDAPELEKFVAGFWVNNTEAQIVTQSEDSITGSGGLELDASATGSGMVLIEVAVAILVNGTTEYVPSIGGIEMGEGSTQIVQSKDPSGIYTFITNQRYDRLYSRNSSPSETSDVKIPDPFFKTAYIGS